MKKITPFLALLTVFCGSFTFSDPSYALLEEEDFAEQRSDAENGRTLGSALSDPNQWESYNQWLCFASDSVEFACAEIDYGADHIPTIRVRSGSDLYDFSLDPEPDRECSMVLQEWQDLLEREPSFCVYAAHLQDVEGPEPWQLWILSQLKTKKGYWVEYEASDDEEPDADIDSFDDNDEE